MNQKVSTMKLCDGLKPINSRSKAAEQLLHTISHYKPPQSETYFLTFNMFQPTRGKSKAKKSCEELLLTTCRTKSWYSLVNSGS